MNDISMFNSCWCNIVRSILINFTTNNYCKTCSCFTTNIFEHLLRFGFNAESDLKACNIGVAVRFYL